MPKKIFYLTLFGLVLFNIFSTSFVSAQPQEPNSPPIIVVPCNSEEPDGIKCESRNGKIPLVPCGNEDPTTKTTLVPCTFKHFMVMVDKIIWFAVFSVAVPVGVIWIMVGGFMMMTAQGNEGKFSKGKSMAQGVIIALLITFAAWLIVDTLITLLGIKG
ncbi:MAG: hypothetical protein WC705_02435 [Candidatus Paceibacterota bacterium]|jgi:hypothetical protein